MNEQAFFLFWFYLRLTLILSHISCPKVLTFNWFNFNGIEYTATKNINYLYRTLKKN